MAYLNYIPFIPLFRFVRIVVSHGGLSAKGIVHLLPWLAKLILLEPLRWSEAILFDRSVSHTNIEYPPVFILGHYRSGTTFLQRIFSCDERFGTMNAYEQILPDMMLLYQKPLKKIMQWVSDLIKAQNHFHRVPYDWSYPGEEDLGLMSGTSSYASSWGFLFPKKFKLIFDAYFRTQSTRLINGWTQDYLSLVKKVTLKNKGKPLILKSPPNTARVTGLLALFPEARFVYISRNPEEMFVSTRRLWKVTTQLHVLGSTKGVDFDELIYYSMELFHQNWVTGKTHIAPGHFVEVNYHDLVAKPEEVMTEIYAKLKLPDFDICKGAVRKFLDAQKNYKTIDHAIPEDLKQHIKSRVMSTAEETKHR